VHARRTAWGLALLVAACSSPAGSPDAASLDAWAADAARSDAGATDGSVDAFVATSDAGADASSACPSRPLVGLFVWNDDLVATRDEILDLAAAHDVTEIYLHANLFYAGDEEESVLADWIAAARARCISVELLFGNARWMLPANRTEATLRTAWAVDFAAAHPTARPSGVHWDLEPQQLTEWSDDAMHPALVGDLVDTLAAMTPVAEAGDLPLSSDVGFFLDGVDVTRGGVTRPGNEWVTDVVSRVVVMDYRDSAESTGHGGMISLAQDEVAYASSVDVPIVLAAETTTQDPEYVSFAEEGLAAMQVELAAVRAHFATERAFVGVAIHDRDGLAALAP
jgi:hypothetical protein